MHSDFSNRTADLLGESRGGIGLGMGLAAQRDVLVYAGHLGDQPRRPAHGDHLLVDSDVGRPGRLAAMAAIRLALGLAALSSTSLLSFLPASGMWAWYSRAKRG